MAKKICFFHQLGKCRNGDMCTYSHVTEEPPVQAQTIAACIFHQKGICRNGDKCAFSHAAQEPQAQEQPTVAINMASGATVQVIRVACDEETNNKAHKTTRYMLYNVPDAHPVFTQGELSPVSVVKIGARLLVLKVRPSLKRGQLVMGKQHWKNPLVGPQYFKNKIAAALMTDLDTGVPPLNWTDDVGCVIIARMDKEPLALDSLESIVVCVEGAVCRTAREAK